MVGNQICMTMRMISVTMMSKLEWLMRMWLRIHKTFKAGIMVLCQPIQYKDSLRRN